MKKRRRRPQKRTQQTRQLLLDSAWELIRHSGELSLTMRALAQQAQVSLGLANVHFGDRDGLLDELRLRVWDALDGVIAEAVGPLSELGAETDYEAKVVDGVRAAARYAAEEPHLFDLVSLAARKRPSERILMRQMETVSVFLKMFVAGQSHGFFRAEADPLAASMALWSGILGYNHWVRAHTPSVVRPFNDRVLDEIIASFLARNSSPAAFAKLKLVAQLGTPEP